MKTLPKIPALLIATNMICCFIRADFDEVLESILICEEPIFSLDLSGNKLGLETAQNIEENLRLNWKIKQLNLSNQEMDSDSAVAMIEALKNNNTIEELNLSQNNINFISESKNCKESKEAQKHPNKTLKILNLSENPLDSSLLGRILYIMSEFMVLEEINLQGTGIEEERMKQIITSNVAEYLELSSVWRVKDGKFIRTAPSIKTSSPCFADDDTPDWKYQKPGTKKQKWREGKTLIEPSSVSEEEKTENDSSSIESDGEC